jgi:hypothetical protein
MRKIFYTLLVVCISAISTTYAQNADQLYFNQMALDHDYQAASFVVDTAPSNSAFKRAFLLWSKNVYRDSAYRFLSLDEFGPTGNFLSEHVNVHKNVSTRSLFPKKIIKAESFDGYYLLGYVTRSFNLINGLQVYSTPVVIKVDANLNPVWVRKIHYAAVSPNNQNALIEYNDIIEARNGEVILAGRFSPYFSGQQQRVLVTRLKGTNGNIIWNYYYFNSPVCNAVALSIAEAKDENIALTGYIENCVSPSFTGTRELLYMLLNPAGSPLITEKLVTGQTSLVGDKIVKHAGGDVFFISGYIDTYGVTGALNRQILIVDIKESGGVISVHHIGDAGTEIANDLIFKDFGHDTYHLFLTGYTSSYDQSVKTEVYYLQLKYSGGGMGLLEFSTFPRPSERYNYRMGVEIKKAGKERFAILDNASYNLGNQSQMFTNVLVRDLNDGSGKCIKRHEPPVVPIDLRIVQLSSDNINPGFRVYLEGYDRFEKVTPQLECGEFIIDAPNAGTIPGNPDEITRKAGIVQATIEKEAEATLRVYPNPVQNELYIEYGQAVKEPVSVKIYSGSMQFIKEYRMAGKNKLAVPVSGLAAGVYFVRVESKAGVQSFKVRKE